ncbi:hypothetical protein [Bacillus licheniformis]|uniref:hypothetical protein n=1 Tax=Bacillus licheniformis TaxID=1402 RepID=UPI001C211F1C|nr:hypothetical protein [Bacillus licheniformis]MBU8739777.1 hypothetical protein [Bacillus licheniformis]
MIVPKFDRDRIIQDAKALGIEVREVAPGEGGVFIQEKDGSERRVTTFDLFPEAKEVADLRCAVAGLIAENKRLKKALKLIESKSELPEESVDLVPITELYEINLHAKEALR